MRKHFCNEEFGSCFAQCKDRDENHRCTILSETYAPGRCPFKKQYRDITDGKQYPFDPFYGMAIAPGKEKEESA